MGYQKITPWLVMGLMLLPIAHVIESFLVIDVANEAIKQCTMDGGRPVGNDLSENLGVLQSIGQSIEESLNNSLAKEIEEKRVVADDIKAKSNILMYASFILLLIDLACFKFRDSVNKFVVNLVRIVFTGFIAVLVYKGVLIVYSISSSRMDAKTYGLFGLLTGGESFGYDAMVALMSTAMYVVPLIVLHVFYYRSTSKYYSTDDEYVHITELPSSESAPSLPQPQQATVPSVAEYNEPSVLTVESSEDDLAKLDELLDAGILTPEEHAEQKKSMVLPSPQQEEQVENNKIDMLRNLKTLLDSEILSKEEYNTQKSNILRIASTPMWKEGKSSVEILIEMKALLDENILSQEEFDFHKKIILNAD